MDKNAEDLKIVDVRKIANFCDFFVILTASSARQGKAIADSIQDGLKKNNVLIRNKEGGEDSEWILLDLFDIVVHIFSSRLREFYKLDRLWSDAPLIDFPVKKDAASYRRRRPPKPANFKGPV